MYLLGSGFRKCIKMYVLDEIVEKYIYFEVVTLE